MPPKARQRGSKPDKKAAAAVKVPEKPSVHAQITEETRQSVVKKKVKWTPVFKTIGVFALILVTPATLNYVVLNREASALILKGGVLYDIGWGQKIFMHCMGEGLPTVILEAPLGQSSDVWVLVHPILAKYTRVCVYDRAGLGFSDRAYRNTSEYADDHGKTAKNRDRTQPSTVERMVDDLHRLVSFATNQPKPLLLVSADFATFISRFYVQIYQHEVAGLLLIDPAIESLFNTSRDFIPEWNRDETTPTKTLWQEYWYGRAVPHMQSVHLSASMGFNRLALMIGLMQPVEVPELYKLLPLYSVTRKKHLLCHPKHLSSSFDEYYFLNETMDQIKTMFHVKPFPREIPITMATYGQTNENLPPELTKEWAEGQKRLMNNIHPHSKQIVLPGADYLILYKNPKAIVSVILQMVEVWRRDARLAG